MQAPRKQLALSGIPHLKKILNLARVYIAMAIRTGFGGPLLLPGP